MRDRPLLRLVLLLRVGVNEGVIESLKFPAWVIYRGVALVQVQVRVQVQVWHAMMLSLMPTRIDAKCSKGH